MISFARWAVKLPGGMLVGCFEGCHLSATMPTMDHSYLLESLNPEQQAAVSCEPQNMLVLAGAGSGKTRVLTQRIAWLMQVEGVSPFAIMAVTFTNKAANEMRGRIESLLQMPVRGMMVGTFHGLAHRLLRSHWQDAGLPESFQILDSDDQYRLIRRVQRSLELNEDRWPPKQTQWFINKSKEKGQRPAQVCDIESSFFTETLQKVYQTYEDVCAASGLVDFTELLLRSLELLQQNEQIREHYQQRLQHILVDEFQDTNTIQYQWLKTLIGPQTYMMAVGDDDQSIYSWRGAQIKNIHKFTKEFANTKTFRLEQNYRSTKTILNAANAVIANNEGRLGKELWTDGDEGDLITLYAAFNERDEAYFITSSIKDAIKNSHKYSDVAILYRSNAQSRILEEKLIDAGIPYRIYGGLKFFERAEIKDALAYLRLMANRHDDAAFERVVNTPTRGIGNTTLNALRTASRAENISLWQTAEHLIENKLLNGRALNCLQQFLDLVNQIHEETKKQTLGEQSDHVLHRSGLYEHYKKDRSEKGLSRVENLQELVGATQQFKPDEEHANLSPLDGFLAHVALETGESQADAQSDSVSLMTLHAAKGLEFPVVFIAGLEEELFPHRMSLEEAQGLEEERRLCYVGMTRAKEKLYLTHAETRRLYGSEKFCSPSRFIKEIPDKFLDATRPTARVSRPVADYRNPEYDQENAGIFQRGARKKKSKLSAEPIQAGDTGFNVGQRVKHKKFGTGVIVNYEGHNEHSRIQVKFDKHGTKWLIASFAKLEAAE
jgi:DNA helicase II / ATP-dependent DNA helicase PcrA